MISTKIAHEIWIEVDIVLMNRKGKCPIYRKELLWFIPLDWIEYEKDYINPYGRKQIQHY